MLQKELKSFFSDYQKQQKQLLIGNKYRLIRQIGIGTFSDIYEGEDIDTYQLISIKIELKKCQFVQLPYEQKHLQQLQGGIGIPKLYHYSHDGDYYIMITEILGPNVEALFNFCNRKFSVKTICMIADQMISRLEYLHSHNLIHRDVKPENFCIGQNKHSSTIYIIDYGITNTFRSRIIGMHNSKQEDKSLTGNARYASVNAHLGIEQSRRDDIESVAYILIYLRRNGLPWQGIQAKTYSEKIDKIKHQKNNSSAEMITQGLEAQFTILLKVARNMQYEEKPDYNYFRTLFRELFYEQADRYDFFYDWEMKNKSKKIIDKLNKQNQATKAPKKSYKDRRPQSQIVVNQPSKLEHQDADFLNNEQQLD